MKSIALSYGLAAVLMSAAGAGSGGGAAGALKAAAGETPAKEAALAKEVESLKAQLAKQAEDHAEALKAADAKSSASLEKVTAAAEGNAFRADILAAVAKLRHGNAADWQEDGRPSLKRIIQLAGNNKITAEDVDKVAGDVRRETVKTDNSETLLKGEDKTADAAPLENVKVRAIEVGQYGGKLRDPGEEFVYSGPKQAWFIKLKG